MSWISRIVRRFRALSSRDAIDRELEEEMRHHVELEAAEIARTERVSPEEARRRALVRFGGVTRFQEEHRDARGIGWIEHTMRDIRHAARSLTRSPGFTVAAVGVLALGIGSTTAVFSAVNAVLRNPAHDEIAVVFFRGYPSLSTVDYRAIAEQQRSFAALGAMRGDRAAFYAGGEPEQVRVGRVTSGFFRVLGARVVAGRLIEPRDEPVGAERVSVVSHDLAVRALGGPEMAVGRSVTVDGISHTVVGVLEPTEELLTTRADVWPALQLAEPDRRGPFGMWVLGRLAPGATFESATRDLSAISERIFPLWSPGFPDQDAKFEAIPIRTAALAASSRMLRIFGIAVALVLLIGVANVASLMLVRAIGRTREISLRSVLGASSRQLVRLFAAESALLSVAGAAAGLAVGASGLRALIRYGPQIPGLTGASLDIRAAIFGIGLAIAAGLVVGTYPVTLLLSGRRVSLSSGDRMIGGGRATRAVRGGFVVAQFALALPLLTISGLLLAGFLRLQQIDPGFDPRNVLTVQVSLPAGQYDSAQDVRSYWTRALPRVREIAGVRSVGLGSSMPPDDFGWSNDNFNLIDKPTAPGTAEPSAAWPTVDAGYFEALGIPILEGRPFASSDTGTAPVVLVTRAWAQKYYPGESPIGKTMTRGGCVECPLTTVIGVVDDVYYTGLTGPRDALHSPVTEIWPRSLVLFVQTAGAPENLATAVREALRSVDPSVPLDDIASLEERMYGAMALPRQWAALVGAFAVTALALAAVGILGMLSYMVGTRRREIGVRLALGAKRLSVVRMIVMNGLTLATVGSAIGVAASLAATRAMSASLYDVGTTDTRTLALAALVLLSVAVLACWMPARRAAAIDPLEALRHE